MQISRFFNSFRFKTALVLIFSIVFVILLQDFFVYEFSFRSQFNQLRDKLTVIAQTAALAIDSQKLERVPLSREGIGSPEYKEILAKLSAIKQANPGLKYIYTMTKADKPGFLQFVVDTDALSPGSKPYAGASYHGDKYDARQLPEMFEAFSHPVADKEIETDVWGKLLSAYAPIRDPSGQAIAILGVDISADDVYALRKAVVQRSLLILLAGIILSLFLGIITSKRLSTPLKELVSGTRHIAAGDLGYRVNVKGSDEISELAESFNGMSSSLYQARIKMHDYFYRVMQSMIRLLESKDGYTKGHSDRVVDYTERIARAMALPEAKIELLKRAAQLHDIGKLGIDERIINKSSGLTEKEREIIYHHPETGESILQPAAFDKEILDLVRRHHEHYDGSGYPDGINGRESDLFYQIIPVADAYDAMTSGRAYRPPLTKQEALQRIQEASGSQFNPEVVEAFLKAFRP